MSAMKAGMSRNTARKYPGQTDAMEQRQVPHTWRTRKDPLEAVWEQALAMLREAPELEAKALFEHLAQGRGEELTPGAYGTTADVASLNFTTWEGWTGGANSGPPSTLGKDAVMHIPGSDIYLDIKFTAWGGAAGGFSYTRSSPPASALAAWRLLHFGSAANSGDGADGNDFDQDGLTNLIRSLRPPALCLSRNSAQAR